MRKFKKLIECYVPIYACNFRCEYCYIKQNPSRSFENKVEKFKYSPEHMAKCMTKERFGGTCLINLCAGGETLLSHETVELAKLLLEEGHYVMIVNNGTCTKHINELISFDAELKSRLWLRFSLHWNELVRTNSLETFFNNVANSKNAGCSIAVEMVASDSYIPFIPDILKKCEQTIKSYPEINIARDDNDMTLLTKLSMNDYVKTWSVFNSCSFNLKRITVGQKRHEFCYAGDWSVTLDLGTGIMSKCYSHPIQNIFVNPDEKIKFEAIGRNCPAPYCFNSHLFLAMGNIPSLDFPTIAQIRGKKCFDGSHWLTKEMQQFVGQKVYLNNRKYSFVKKVCISTRIRIIKLINKLERTFRRKNANSR